MASGNQGILGKFQERLRRIKMARLKKDKMNEEFVRDKVEEIHHIPPVSSRPHIKVVGGSDVKLEMKEDKHSKNVKKDTSDKLEEHDKVLHKYVGKDSNSLKSNNKNLNNYVGISNENEEVFEKDDDLQKIKAELIRKIRVGFQDQLDELELLEGEVSYVSSLDGDVDSLEEIQELKKKIDSYIEKIHSMMSSYRLYKDLYYLEDFDSYDDMIVTDLIKYRDKVNDIGEEKRIVSEYKKLDEYRLLYQELHSVQKSVEDARVKFQTKSDYLSHQDKYLNYCINEMNHAKEKSLSCLEEIHSRNQYFKELLPLVDKISSHDYTTYHLKGMGELLSSGIKYLGLLALSPFRGTFPGIAIRTLATKQLVSNAYQHLHFEEEKRTRYEAISYDDVIRSNLMNIDNIEELLCDTLKDIERLRSDFKIRYDSSLSNYGSTLDKIDSIYYQVLSHQNKVNKLRERFVGAKKVNEEKLIRVKEMNQK